MDLYEHQARDLFEAHGVAVPRGRVASSAAEAERVARELRGPVVVKAQVKTGGRGKAGGVRLAHSAEEAASAAAAILRMDIKGHQVHRVLVVEASDIAREFYASFLLDRANRSFLAMASAEGGMEIEQLAAERPEALARIPIDPLTGCDTTKAKEIAAAALLPPEAADALVALWDAFVAEDATLVEVNPLAADSAGRITALDGKVTLDGNAAFRHPEHAELDDPTTRDPLESAAAERGLNYVKLDGQVGVIGNGAGLVMATLDVVALAGQRHGVGPANFLDIGGGANARVMADGLDIILRDPDVRSVFVNVFGGITACDQVADGIVAALGILGENATKPIVVRLDGNNVDAGIAILDAATHPLVTVVDTMDAAAQLAAELAMLPASGGRS